MPMIHECAHESCTTLTMGRYCIEHETAAGAAPARNEPEPDRPAAEHRERNAVLRLP